MPQTMPRSSKLFRNVAIPAALVFLYNKAKKPGRERTVENLKMEIGKDWQKDENLHGIYADGDFIREDILYALNKISGVRFKIIKFKESRTVTVIEFVPANSIIKTVLNIVDEATIAAPAFFRMAVKKYAEWKIKATYGRYYPLGKKSIIIRSSGTSGSFLNYRYRVELRINNRRRYFIPERITDERLDVELGLDDLQDEIKAGMVSYLSRMQVTYDTITVEKELRGRRIIVAYNCKGGKQSIGIIAEGLVVDLKMKNKILRSLRLTSWSSIDGSGNDQINIMEY